MKDRDIPGHVRVDGWFRMRELTLDERWFRDLFESHHRDLLAYAARRLSSFDDANDVVSEVFVVAWRRRAEIPDGREQERMWLYGVARRTLSNVRRSDRRWAILVDRMGALVDLQSDGIRVDDQSDVLDAYRALAQLREDDREILLLSLWEDLAASQIADVMRLSPAIVSVRLHRAKARLRRHFAQQVKDHRPGGHVEERARGEAAPERTV